MSGVLMMRRWVRFHGTYVLWQNYLFGLVLGLVLAGGYVFFTAGETKSDAANSFTTVERDTIVTSVKATGTVTFANEQKLRFNQKGKVARVLVREGDRVERGQMIAELDAVTVQADIRQAQLSLGAASLQLQQMDASREKSVLDAENALRESERQFADAQNALTVAQSRLPADLAQARRTLAEREAALVQARAALAQAEVTTLQDLASIAQDILTQSESLLDTFYAILTNDTSARRSDDRTAPEVYYRLYNDYVLRDDVSRAYGDAVRMVDEMRARYGSSLTDLRAEKEIASALSHATQCARTLQTLADAMYRMMQGAIEDPVHFTLSNIAAIKQSIVSARMTTVNLLTNAENGLAGLMGDENGMTSIAIQQKRDALASAQHALLSAQDQLQILETQTPGNLQQQQDALTRMQEERRARELALAQTQTNADVDLRLRQNDIAQKATSLRKTQATLEDYQLAAPFDGVIRRLDYQVGDNLLDTGEDKYIVLENPDTLIVTILLDQVDVVRVRKDMHASIVFDALPGRTYRGVIDDINSSPIESSGVVSYEVAIRLPTPEGLTILSGMTAVVQIETARQENVLIVPNLALRRTNGQVTVLTADGRTVAVETGVTDGRVTEIRSGLQEGDRVLSLNVESARGQSDVQSNSMQLLRMGGGGGFGTRNIPPSH